MDIRLDNKNAIVCGSSQGIGKAAAIEFSKLGANVTLIERNEQSLKKVLGELANSDSQKHEFIAVDFSYPEKLYESIKMYVKNNKPIHILVNNSGGPNPGTAIDAKPEEYEQAFKQHLICNQILVQAVVPGMKKEKYGRIINIIST